MDSRILATTYPEPKLRNLVANLRWLHVRPFLAETSLEDVVEIWQQVQREERAHGAHPIGQQGISAQG